MSDLPKCRLSTWSDVDAWARSLAAQVRAAGRTPEVLLGLTRGGWVPARLVADLLGVKRLLALQTAHWGVTATKDGHAALTERLTASVEGSTVLLVDDITDTGESLALAADHVRTEGRPARLETATCLHVAHSKFAPTYFAEEIPADRWVWVVFPWTYWEDLRALSARALPEGKDAAGVAQLLREGCHLTVPPADVERALRESAASSAQ
ncbi:MAG: phosphoribosyltransferase [Thermoplasmata archaeon]|nr:phosphoribosyltransferase [Thermoplasmata archaeon]